jgi:hypothetical protein
MAIRTRLYTDTSVEQVLKPANYTTDQLSAAANTQGYHDLMPCVNVGTSADTLSPTVYIALELQHSDDGITYVACLDSEIINPVAGLVTGTFAKIAAAGQDAKRYITAYLGAKQYVKVNVNFVGTHANGTPISVTMNQGSADYAAVNA